MMSLSFSLLQLFLQQIEKIKIKIAIFVGDLIVLVAKTTMYFDCFFFRSLVLSTRPFCWQLTKNSSHCWLNKNENWKHFCSLLMNSINMNFQLLHLYTCKMEQKNNKTFLFVDCLNTCTATLKMFEWKACNGMLELRVWARNSIDIVCCDGERCGFSVSKWFVKEEFQSRPTSTFPFSLHLKKNI